MFGPWPQVSRLDGVDGQVLRALFVISAAPSAVNGLACLVDAAFVDSNLDADT